MLFPLQKNSSHIFWAGFKRAFTGWHAVSWNTFCVFGTVTVGNGFTLGSQCIISRTALYVSLETGDELWLNNLEYLKKSIGESLREH